MIPTYTLEGQGLKITQALAQAGVVKGGGGAGDPARHHLAAVRLRAEGRQGRRSAMCASCSSIRPTSATWCKNFVSAFKAKFNADPTHLNAHAYDQIMLIADVVKRGAKDAQSIRDTLAATKNFVGVTGSVEFDKNNQNTKMDTIHYMETKPDLSWKALKWN